MFDNLSSGVELCKPEPDAAFETIEVAGLLADERASD